MSEIPAESAEMSIGKGVAIYAGALLGFIILIVLTVTVSWFPGFVLFFAYFVFGFILNRIVLRSLIEWHAVYNTLGNVSSSKLSAFLFWPFSYPALFFRLGVVKHL
ncbi:hypothetical protein D8B23_13085 [Verminephrobacter aporrectodeae subsp. tuberculatae]|uniref:Uncharacterized protein n=3 Tax=Verminephrobacter TaxID=364316 RepID=A0ABT3KND7_9BURK|nr:hypothetical protein [Verminephrobacter aporrectodeae subsp. tuberculatae]MCW5254983.1 hypothetical protein [Verminephrobacter aporrectodeae subsp. tuberculatae]MCW5290515.1 hypothetical protein [Verminephrobacter aporrectodeae subsp. tuberculatae]MCW5319817.1 hypothetical protein [Verminephrobacter aporrectodeae subsp. tuberculatae]MCW8166277.1 hypothetical protein [Verminephrobacter aporrectodeae subsp. tuberculatae]